MTNTKVSKFFKPFANDPLANIKFSKTQSSKFELSGGILGELIAAMPGATFLARKEALAEKATEYYIN